MIPCGPKITCVFERATRTVNAIGSNVTAWATTATVDGTMTTMNGNERKMYEKETTDALYKLYTPPLLSDSTTLSVSANDRMTYSGREFDVLFVDNPFQANKLFVIYLREVV